MNKAFIVLFVVAITCIGIQAQAHAANDSTLTAPVLVDSVETAPATTPLLSPEAPPTNAKIPAASKVKRGPSKEETQAKLHGMRDKVHQNREAQLSPPPMRVPSSAPASASSAVASEKQNDPVTTVKPNISTSPPSPMPTASKDGIPEQISKFKDVVNDSQKQYIQPDKRQFASLARNYVNRLTCAGQIEKMIVPQDQGLEAEITNDNHDLFLRVGSNPNAQFPVDMSLICDGQVFIINAVVHPHVPTQEIVLQLPTGMRPLSPAMREEYEESIKAAEALPLEERISKMMPRLYKGDFLPYWREVDSPTSQSLWSYGNYSVLLQKVVKVELDNLVAWDFVFRGRFPAASFYDVIRKIVRGEVVAFGKVAYEGQSAVRVIVITREQPNTAKRS